MGGTDGAIVYFHDPPGKERAFFLPASLGNGAFARPSHPSTPRPARCARYRARGSAYASTRDGILRKRISDFDIKRRIISRDTFEEQLTVAMFAVHGGKRLNEVAHVLPPSFSPSIADCGVRALTWVTWRWPHAAVCELLSALRRKVHGPNRFRKLSPCPDISRDDRRDRVARCGMVPFRSANFP